ncbi:MAG: mechanosensitive ion channel family protein [Alphaproteobacteria bacterium]|nr:mechanosensitive ion channel family protein [Alphaproteobacteria bacterium]
MPEHYKILQRLWAPCVLFAVFITGATFTPDLLRSIGADALERVQQVFTYGVQIGLWLSGAYLIVRIVNVFFWDAFVGRLIDTPVPRLLKDTFGLVVFIVAGAGIVGIVFNQSVTGIWATSGAIGIILGLALRSIILDIFTGLAINVDRSYRIGDWVELNERPGPVIRGKVLEINWRTTRLQIPTGRIVMVPNSRMGTMIIANLSMPDTVCRFDVNIVLDFSVPRARALRVLLAGAKAACGPDGPLTTPAPRVLVNGLTELGVEYRVIYWHTIDNPMEGVGRNTVVQSLLHHLMSAGLSPAYPKQDTFSAEMPVRQLEHQSATDRTELLGRLEILQSLLPMQLEELAGQVRLRHFAAGEALVEQGEPGASMFVLAEGLCEVWQLGDGTLRNLAVIQPGEFVGEMSLLTGEPRSATVKAATDVVGYELTAEQLAPILAESPELYEEMSVVVAERRLRTSRRLAELDAESRDRELLSTSAQILEKMRNFFRLISRAAGSGRRARPAIPGTVGTA